MFERKWSAQIALLTVLALGSSLSMAPAAAANDFTAAADCTFGVFTDVEDRSNVIAGSAWVDCTRTQAFVYAEVRLYGGGNLLALHVCDQPVPARSCSATARITDRWAGNQSWHSVVVAHWSSITGAQTKTSNTISH